MFINYTGVKSDDIEKLFSFLNLRSFEKNVVESLLKKKINSVEERFNLVPRFPHWRMWETVRTNKFNRIAADVMTLLGYYQ